MPRPTVPGVNDLATKRPDLVSQWIVDLNLPATPQTVAGGSNFLAWWRCEKGHEWQTAVTSRVYMNSGCPYCSGKRPIQGETDLQSQRPDWAAEWHPTLNGNLRPSDVTIGSEKRIWWKCVEGHEWDAVVYSRIYGDCPHCSGHRVIQGVNDLQTLFPNIADQWHTSKNGGILPTEVMAGSNQKVWWRCNLGHEWKTQPAKRTANGRNCPICANQKVLAGFNDLESKHPGIAAEWHPTKNETKQPSDVLAGTPKKFWWVCSNGHEYLTSVTQRTARGTGCPTCSAGGGFDSTQASFLYLIQSVSLGARKIGIGNLNAGRLEKYDSENWEVIKVIHHENGLLIREIETRTLRWIRNDLGMPQQLSRTEMKNAGGWSETFSLGLVSNQEIIEFISHLFQTLPEQDELFKIQPVDFSSEVL